MQQAGLVCVPQHVSPFRVGITARWAAAGAAGAAYVASTAGPLSVAAGAAEPGGSAGAAGTSAAPAAAASTGDALALVRAENAALRARLDALVEATLPAELHGDGNRQAEQQDILHADSSGSNADADGNQNAVKPAASGVVVAGKPQTGRASGGGSGSGMAPGSAGVDAAYFESYSYFDIHREMLGDKVRCGARIWGQMAVRVQQSVRGACTYHSPPVSPMHTNARSRAQRPTASRWRPTPAS